MLPPQASSTFPLAVADDREDHDPVGRQPRRPAGWRVADGGREPRIEVRQFEHRDRRAVQRDGIGVPQTQVVDQDPVARTRDRQAADRRGALEHGPGVPGDRRRRRRRSRKLLAGRREALDRGHGPCEYEDRDEGRDGHRHGLPTPDLRPEVGRHRSGEGRTSSILGEHVSDASLQVVHASSLPIRSRSVSIARNTSERAAATEHPRACPTCSSLRSA